MNQHHYFGLKRFAGRGLRCDFEWRGNFSGFAGWWCALFQMMRLPIVSFD